MVNNQTEPILLESFMFTKIFQTFRMAIHPSKLTIGFAAIAIICITGTLMDLTKPVVVRPGTDGKFTELNVYLLRPDHIDAFIKTNKDIEKGTGVFKVLWSFAADKFEKTISSIVRLNFPEAIDNILQYLTAVGWALKYHYIYCIIFGIIKLIVICIAGGAICRISALQLALGEKPGISGAIRYSIRKLPSFAAAPLAPIGISIFLGLVIFLIGLLGNIPYAGEILVSLGMIFFLVVGTLMAIVLIGTIGGFNLMFPSLAYDGLDCFDAISRSFNYVYSKPWRMVFYTTVAAVYGSICYIFVRFFAFLLLLATHWSLRLGIFTKGSQGINKLDAIWTKPEFSNIVNSTTNAASWSEIFSSYVIYLFLLLVAGLVAAFVLSFYFTANTIIYSLMRNKVDNTPIDEIHIATEQIEIRKNPVQEEVSKDKNTLSKSDQ